MARAAGVDVRVQFTIVATFLQVYSLTRSTVAVGLIGLVGFLALVVGTLAGGTFLDAFDRRKILITAQVGYLASSGLLFAGAVHGDPPLALIYVAVAGIAATSAIDSPTRSAMTPGCWTGAAPCRRRAEPDHLERRRS